MKTENNNKLKMQRVLSVLTAVIGALLMIYMVTVESEPGALPLLLVILGSGWYLVTRYRNRSQYESG